MTHKDIYIKFMIEYDKANVTSSYPSLTEYEVATVLDKAYNALIAQKVTGNNFRRSTFESDVKAIADLQPLIKSIILHRDLMSIVDNATQTVTDEDLVKVLDFDNLVNSSNAYTYSLDKADDFLYFLQCYIAKQNRLINNDGFLVDALSYLYKDANNDVTPSNTKETLVLPVKLLNHELANQFYNTAHNLPWVKDPICYLENNKLIVVADGYDKPESDAIRLIYVKLPNLFVKSDKDLETAILLTQNALGEFCKNITVAPTNVSSPIKRYNVAINAYNTISDGRTIFTNSGIKENDCIEYIAVLNTDLLKNDLDLVVWDDSKLYTELIDDSSNPIQVEEMLDDHIFVYEDSEDKYVLLTLNGGTGVSTETILGNVGVNKSDATSNHKPYYTDVNENDQTLTIKKIIDENTDVQMVVYGYGASSGFKSNKQYYYLDQFTELAGTNAFYIDEDLDSNPSNYNVYYADVWQVDAGQFSISKYKVISDQPQDVTDQYYRYHFELNDTMAEELISLAIAFALENVESPRLNSRLNMRGLEA